MGYWRGRFKIYCVVSLLFASAGHCDKLHATRVDRIVIRLALRLCAWVSVGVWLLGLAENNVLEWWVGACGGGWVGGGAVWCVCCGTGGDGSTG